MKLATIDIGTHSVLLLIAEQKSNGKWEPLFQEATLTRIGEGMASHHVFLPGGMERTLAVLKKYKSVCDQHGVDKIITVGTAAFRKAQNAKEFVEQTKQECGIKISIIPGEEEAKLTWLAASTDFGEEIAVLDIGGGSTEVIFKRQCHFRTSGNPSDLFTVSMPIGSVLLTEKHIHTDPVSDKEQENFCNEIDEHIARLNLKTVKPPHVKELVATAGTPTTLSAMKQKMVTYQHHEIHGALLTLSEVEAMIIDLKSKTLEERKKIAGLEPGRADVILIGATLLQKVARELGVEKITVSDRGVRWGLVYQY